MKILKLNTIAYRLISFYRFNRSKSVWWCGGGGGVVVLWWLKPILVFSLAQAEQLCSKIVLNSPLSWIHNEHQKGFQGV